MGGDLGGEGEDEIRQALETRTGTAKSIKIIIDTLKKELEDPQRHLMARNQ